MADVDDEMAEDERPSGHPPHLPWPPPERPYPANSFGHRDEESKAPFNEEWALDDFGEEFLGELKRSHPRFCGDWWQLAFLIRHSEADQESYRQVYLEAIDDRFKHWAAWFDLGKHQIHLEHAWLDHGHFEGVNLAGAHLEHSRFNNARLEHAVFRRACMERAQLARATLSHADFTLATLRHANFREAELESVDFREAILEDADLRSARLDGARLGGARLDRADVRGAFDLTFDDTHVDRLRINGDAPDRWSVLRRTYTGPRFLLNLLLLIGFLLPYGARVVYLSALSETREAVQQAVVTAEETLSQAEERLGAENRTIAAMRDWIESFDRSHREVPAVWVLIGGSKGWLYLAMTLAIVAYNALRAHLTLKVSALRDGEESSHITPPSASYSGLYKQHLFASILYWVSVGSLVWSTGEWLWTTRVWIAL